MARAGRRGGARRQPGRAVQVAPIKPKLKAPGIVLLKPGYDEPVSSSAFKIQLAPLQPGRGGVGAVARGPGVGDGVPVLAGAQRGQGLTLVHFSAQRKRFLWERGACWGRVGVV